MDTGEPAQAQPIRGGPRGLRHAALAGIIAVIVEAASRFTVMASGVPAASIPAPGSTGEARVPDELASYIPVAEAWVAAITLAYTVFYLLLRREAARLAARDPRLSPGATGALMALTGRILAGASILLALEALRRLAGNPRATGLLGLFTTSLLAGMAGFILFLIGDILVGLFITRLASHAKHPLSGDPSLAGALYIVGTLIPLINTPPTGLVGNILLLTALLILLNYSKTTLKTQATHQAIGGPRELI